MKTTVLLPVLMTLLGSLCHAVAQGVLQAGPNGPSTLCPCPNQDRRQNPSTGMTQEGVGQQGNGNMNLQGNIMQIHRRGNMNVQSGVKQLSRIPGDIVGQGPGGLGAVMGLPIAGMNPFQALAGPTQNQVNPQPNPGPQVPQVEQCPCPPGAQQSPAFPQFVSPPQMPPAPQFNKPDTPGFQALKPPEGPPNNMNMQSGISQVGSGNVNMQSGVKQSASRRTNLIMKPGDAGEEPSEESSDEPGASRRSPTNMNMQSGVSQSSGPSGSNMNLQSDVHQSRRSDDSEKAKSDKTKRRNNMNMQSGITQSGGPSAGSNMNIQSGVQQSRRSADNVNVQSDIAQASRRGNCGFLLCGG